MLTRKILTSFYLILLRAYQTASKNKRVVTTVLILASLLFCYGIGKLKFVLSAEDMAGEGISSADELSSLNDRYIDGTSSILFLTPPSGQFSFSVQELCIIRKWYSITRLINPELKSTSSTFDAEWPLESNERNFKYHNILELDCDRMVATQNLRDVKEAFQKSPWATLHDAKDQLPLIFSFTFSNAEDPKFGSFNPRVVTPLHENAEKILAPKLPGATFHWVGAGDYQWYVQKGLAFSLLVNSAMVVFLIVALRIFFGTWISGIIFCSTLVLNAIWIYGAKALLGSPYDVLSSGIFLILGVSSLEDFVFVSALQMNGSHWKSATKKMLVPSFFTSLTTLVGFISLYTSHLEIIRRFGVWAAVGGMSEWLMIFFFLPSVLSNFSGMRSWVNPSRSRGLHFIERLSLRSIPRWLSRFVLVILPLGVFAFLHLNANDTPSSLFPSKHPYNVGLNALVDSKGWRSSVSLVMDSADNSKLEEYAEKLKTDPVLHGSIVEYETAKNELAWLGQNKNLPQGTISSQFAMSLAYKQMVDGDGVARAALYVRDISVQDLQLLKSEAKRICGPDCHAAGYLIAYSDFCSNVPKTLLDSISLSLLLVALIIGFLAAALGKLRMLPALLLSAFWGPSLMIVVLWVFNIPMDFLKCIFASVLVGLTGDNAVQYLFASGRQTLKKGIEKRGGASIQTNVFMAGTALMYLTSYFGPPKVFGIILSSGLIAALIGDLWLLNGLLGSLSGRLGLKKSSHG